VVALLPPRLMQFATTLRRDLIATEAVVWLVCACILHLHKVSRYRNSPDARRNHACVMSHMPAFKERGSVDLREPEYT